MSTEHIRALVEDRINAVRNKDINELVSKYAPDVLSFDVVDPLLSTGSEAIRKRLEEWFASFQGPISFEIRGLSIVSGDDAAFCHGLSGVSGIRTGGEQLNMWYRTTICYRKIDGKWVIVHEHNSVPFNVETGKASLDLKS